MGKSKKIQRKAVTFRIDDKPPALPVALVTKPRLVNQIAMDTRLLDLDNVNLLHKLYKIHVTHGWNSTFRRKAIPMGRTNFEGRKREALIIERANQRLNCKLDNAGPRVDTVEKLAKHWESSRKAVKSTMNFPGFFENKRRKDFVAVLGAPRYLIDKRPRVKMELFLKDHGCIGTCTIMLYPDYEPKLCKNFLKQLNRKCTCQCPCNHFKINHIIPNFFFAIEGPPTDEDISMEDETPHILQHAETGVLTTPQTKTNRFSYLITFRPLPCMDSSYIAFGKIIRGLKIVRGIESFGVKTGHPLRELTLKIQQL